MVNLGGFDTHSSQVDNTSTLTGRHADLLADLSEAINAFMTDLNFLGTADRVVVSLSQNSEGELFQI